MMNLQKDEEKKNKNKSKKQKQNKTKPRKKTYLSSIVCIFLVYKLFNRTIYTQGECKLMYYVLYVFTIKLPPAVKKML